MEGALALPTLISSMETYRMDAARLSGRSAETGTREFPILLGG